MQTANPKIPKDKKPPPLRLLSRLAFRLPEQVANDWRKQAGAAGISLSDWLRAKVDVAQTTGIAPPAKAPKRRKYTPVDPALLFQVAQIGNNLNQIARHINSRNVSITSVHVLALLTSIRRDLSEMIDTRSKQDA